MEMMGPLPLKLAGNSYWIVVKDRFSTVITLLEADTFAISQVNCRPNLHDTSLCVWDGQ
jgi:hypothetical protein